MPEIVDAPTDFVLPTRFTAPPRLTERYPWLYPVAVKVLQARRHMQWLRTDTAWASERDREPLSHRVKQHKSLLLRTVDPDQMWLQHNKITNLRLASGRVDGLVLRPGETFSFNRQIGNCTRRKGYVEGMRLSGGTARPGVGGGICQLANLLHWMVLHSALTVVERSEHSFDPFPDNGRVLPWGVGCSIAYNYVDFVVRNDTDASYQLFVAVGERYLEGELRTDAPPEHSYRVFARDEQFLHFGDDFYRRNEICRTVIDRRTGSTVGEELVKANFALVKYTPGDVSVIDCDGLA